MIHRKVGLQDDHAILTGQLDHLLRRLFPPDKQDIGDLRHLRCPDGLQVA